MTNILLINGSPSAPSRSQGILEYAITKLSAQGVKTDLLSVRDLPAEDLVFGKYNSPNLEPAKALLAEADAVIIATPIYKASYTGLLKTFLDLLPQKALSNKVILPIATGGTIAHLLAIDFTLKPVLAELGAHHILGVVYAVDKQVTWSEDKTVILEAEIDQRLDHSLETLLTVVKH
ncbi:MAG: NADPH-dependent FMN reductase [Pseudanabaena sp. ELA607]|jgi:FMN reductase